MNPNEVMEGEGATAQVQATAPDDVEVSYPHTIYEILNKDGDTIGYYSNTYVALLNGDIMLQHLPKSMVDDFTKNIRKGSKRYAVLSYMFRGIIPTAKYNNVSSNDSDAIITYIENENSSRKDMSKSIDSEMGKDDIVIPQFVTIQDEGSLKLELDTKDNKVYCLMSTGVRFPCTEEGYATFLSAKSTVQPIVKKIKKAEEGGVSIGLGDTVLLWGPTGTGKTFRFHEKVDELMKAGTIDYAEKITVTDGFEDTDFLAYISPKANGGLSITEKNIVKVLREASKGKKVAICIDELNRGSKSLMNLILTFIDPVDGNNYVLNNFVKDETIIIPRENILVYATINLGGRYNGTNSMDEALKDRFMFNQYVGYNLENEKELIKGYFGDIADKVETAIKEIRELYTDGVIGSSISTRGLKSWGETYARMPIKSPKTLLKSFMDTLMYKLTSPDDYGVYSSLEEASVLQVLKPLI